VYDFNGDNAIDSNDLVTLSGGNYSASGVKSTVGIPSEPAIIKLSNYLNRIILGGSDGKLQSLLSGSSSSSVGRQSWRQLI
jgi:hypothetical protein